MGRVWTIVGVSVGVFALAWWAMGKTRRTLAWLVARRWWRGPRGRKESGESEESRESEDEEGVPDTFKEA